MSDTETIVDLIHHEKLQHLLGGLISSFVNELPSQFLNEDSAKQICELLDANAKAVANDAKELVYQYVIKLSQQHTDELKNLVNQIADSKPLLPIKIEAAYQPYKENSEGTEHGYTRKTH